MQRVLSTLGQIFRKSIVILSLVGLLSLSGLFIFGEQPGYAASSKSLSPGEKIDRAYDEAESAGIREEAREEAYETAAKEAENPRTMEKAYEQDFKAYKEDNPDAQAGLVEEAKELVDKVTGND